MTPPIRMRKESTAKLAIVAATLGVFFVASLAYFALFAIDYSKQ